MPKQVEQEPVKCVTVSTRAVIQRINRKLAPYGERLRTSRSPRWWTDLGDFYVMDCARNFLVESHIDLEQLGRRLNALRDWEGVATEN